MSEFRQSLRPSCYFHIYNHAVGYNNFFRTEADYNYFLKKMKTYLLPVTDILAYCLQPDHFQLLVRIKDKKEVIQFIKQKIMPKKFENLITKEDFLENQLSRIYANFFSSYALYYNGLHERTGTLFKRAFMREAIESMDEVRIIATNIHQIPVKECLVSGPEQWKYSSYNSIMNRSSSLIPVNEVLDLLAK